MIIISDTLYYDQISSRRKTITILYIVVIFSLIVSNCSPFSATSSQPTQQSANSKSVQNLVRLTNGEWIPYNGSQLDHYGCDSWAVSEAFALEGIKVEYGFFPWARGYALAAEGTWDGTLAWADTPSHRETFYMSDECTTIQEWVFYYRVTDHFDWAELSDLNGLTVGITTGFVYSDAFEEIKKTGLVKFEEASNDEANFRKLIDGRIDVFPLEKQVGARILRNNFIDEEQATVTAHPKVISAFRPYLFLSKKVKGNLEKMNSFNSGWKKLKVSGRYDEIISSCSFD